jgi:alpha-beta hydrolase superfamily lysophospholipase
MEKIINFEKLRYFAYANDHICKKPIRGIIMDFWGMDSTGILNEDPDNAKYYAEKGILFLIPYYNPWAFCNRQTRAYIEEVLDVVYAHFDLPADFPLVYTGNSMGGLTALCCTVLCKYKAVACLANCPVCDMGDHLYERPDLPHALYNTFGTYEGTLKEAMLTVSPLHLIDKMPDIPYIIFCGEEDKLVNKKKHSDRFVQEMKKSHRITYYEIPEMGHCNLPEEMKLRYREIAANAILNN